MQAQQHARDTDILNLRRWLDQAQGQLQNTQIALTLKEQECKELICAVQEQHEYSLLQTAGLEKDTGMGSWDIEAVCAKDKCAAAHRLCQHGKGFDGEHKGTYYLENVC